MVIGGVMKKKIRSKKNNMISRRSALLGGASSILLATTSCVNFWLTLPKGTVPVIRYAFIFMATCQTILNALARNLFEKYDKM